MWVTTDAGLLLGIDPVAGRITRTVRLGAGRVWAAAGRDSTWASAPDGRILRLDPAGTSTATLTGGGGPIAVKEGSVWIRTDRTLIRLDERTGRSLQRTDIGTSGDVAIAWALPSIVSLGYDDVDALVAPRESWIAETPTSLWIARPDKGEVWVLQPPTH
jgi:sugar lactone lactonase YvrE